jgi:hypothetical protein
VLPFTVDQGRWILFASFHDMLRLALLLGAGRAEVDTAKVSGHQKLVVASCATRARPSASDCPRRAIVPGRSRVGDHCIPGAERQRPGACPRS